MQLVCIRYSSNPEVSYSNNLAIIQHFYVALLDAKIVYSLLCVAFSSDRSSARYGDFLSRPELVHFFTEKPKSCTFTRK
jgi:hypothetical protein